jgi:hypothetical protein
MAIVPDSEWRIPILIVSSARAVMALNATAPPTKAAAARNIRRLDTDIVDPILSSMIESAARKRLGLRVGDRKGCAKVCEQTKWRYWPRFPSVLATK